MRSGQESKRGVLRDFAVNHRDELVPARRVIEPHIEVFKEPSRDVAEHVELVERPQEERLMQHCRE